MTVLGLLLRTGKSHSSDTVTVSQKPLRRGHEFFFGGYMYSANTEAT